MSVLLAYIDPATGAIILQMIVAFVVGVGIVFRRIFFSPFALIASCFRKSDDQSDPDDDSTAV